ncbi:heat-inducible transcriptional repressor HrcA [bacterium]|nr:heat-inducible transcriptional repressor HrcA [bacterium]MBU1615751.1 heat-inducible transcriptional repressor HrcA [bacterium]
MNKERAKERRNEVLQLIVRIYTCTARPVSSQRVIEEGHLPFSSATIRSTMAELEEEGCIAQPHLSAGRVPTDVGYRFYVDSLMHPDLPTEEERRYIASEYEDCLKEEEEIVRKTSILLSNLFSCPGIAISPSTRGHTIKKLELVFLEDQKLLFILATNRGLVEHRVILSSSKFNKTNICKANNFLDQKTEGLFLDEVIFLEDQLREGLKKLTGEELIDRIIKILKDIYSKESEVYLEGIGNIFEQPEFEDMAALKKVFGILEKKERLSLILNRHLKEELSVSIGQENDDQEMKECSLISASYKIREKPVGTFGLIGPTRMKYFKVIPLMELVAKTLNRTLNRFF